MDENLQIKKYKMQSRTMKMKLIDDFRVSEDARKVIIGGSKYAMTNDSLYTSKEFFLIMKKQASNKDSLPEFEMHREKNVDSRLTSKTLCLGPYLSVDKQNLVYIYKSNKTYRETIL